jgi:hypothetical protein
MTINQEAAMLMCFLIVIASFLLVIRQALPR